MLREPKPAWTDTKVQRLRVLWGEGASESEIGRQLNVSKAAVNSKRRRMHLPGRESPIRRAPKPQLSDPPAARPRPDGRGPDALPPSQANLPPLPSELAGRTHR